MRRIIAPKSAVMLLLRVLLIIVGLFILPLGAHALWWSLRDDVAPNYRQADWSSAHLLPEPAAAPQAIVAIYAARVGRWRGIFAHHTWVVVKAAGAAHYTRYDKVGWGLPVRTNGWAPDGRWFGNAPRPIVLIEGDEAQTADPADPGRRRKLSLPGLGRLSGVAGPELQYLRRPRDALRAGAQRRRCRRPRSARTGSPCGDIVGLTPSRTGVQVSLGGYAGLSVGWVEGIEVDFLGLVAGIDLRRPALKLPGWGRIGMQPIVW